MEDAIFSPGAMLGVSVDSAMDFDYMDELLLEGCWLETAEGSDILNLSPSSSSAFFDTSFIWPMTEPNSGDLGAGLSHMHNQGENQRSLLPENSQMNGAQGESLDNPHFSQNMADIGRSNSFHGNSVTDSSELSRRWWIGPRTNSGTGTSVMQRLIQALGYIKDFAKEKDVLVQLWLPVTRGGKRVLTTSEQPFSLNPNSQRLASYRNISVKYQFSAEEDSKDTAGLPGRVFLSKVPEWTPDVRFFRSDEYPRVGHAQQHDIRGTLALPVFEQGSRTCLGVIEVVMTKEKIKIQPELESVSKALEAVNLRSYLSFSDQNIKACSNSYQAALPEIKEVLRCACVSHRLPLAQTWIPCIQQGKEGCRHSTENYIHCVSTVDDACYIADPNVRSFHEACSEHHLLKGQGVAGGAFMTNQPCFSADITSFKKTEYPLAHHARMFSLHAAVAIRLRCIHTGKADFVVEFFLPADCRDPEGHKKMLNSLSIIIRQVCSSLRVLTDTELEEERDMEVSEVISPSDGLPSREEFSKEQHIHHAEVCSEENSSWTACLTEVQQSSNAALVLGTEKSRAVPDEKLSEVKQHEKHISPRKSVDWGDSLSNEIGFSSMAMGRTGEKRRSKAEKTITLQVLRQYFAGSLKDAAKSIGVCPTTLKRICRQHGIKRWPSRKIKKVGLSLQKLQNVIDSVQGASGALHISSFYADFPELASPKLSGGSNLFTAKPKETSIQPEGGNILPQAASSNSPSSSYSQSSNSSQCCSTETHQPSNNSGTEDVVFIESSGDIELKRVKSDAELHVLSQEGTKLFPRSQSLRSLNEQQLISANLQPVMKKTSHIAPDSDAQRIKVTYGDEKIRFRMQSKWRFKDLLHEIGQRFNIIDYTHRFDLKYLDDDSEWVLLTCDADLEECIDICRSCQGNTIRLSLQASHNHLDPSSGSTGLS